MWTEICSIDCAADKWCWLMCWKCASKQCEILRKTINENNFLFVRIGSYSFSQVRCVALVDCVISSRTKISKTTSKNRITIKILNINKVLSETQLTRPVIVLCIRWEKIFRVSMAPRSLLLITFFCDNAKSTHSAKWMSNLCLNSETKQWVMTNYSVRARIRVPFIILWYVSVVESLQYLIPMNNIIAAHVDYMSRYQSH